MEKSLGVGAKHWTQRGDKTKKKRKGKKRGKKNPAIQQQKLNQHVANEQTNPEDSLP